jgi:hypothetical protein
VFEIWRSVAVTLYASNSIRRRPTPHRKFRLDGRPHAPAGLLSVKASKGSRHELTIVPPRSVRGSESNTGCDLKIWD